MIRCIAVDDEPLALEKLEKFIHRISYFQLTGSFDNGLEALQFLKKNQVDLLFLDIQMDDLTGLQLLEVAPGKPFVVLTTAYDQYALKGFELDVDDYLLKPFSFPRFMAAAEKVYEKWTIRQDRAQRSTISDSREYIMVRSEYRLLKVRLDEVLYIEGMKDYSRIFTTTSNIMTLMNLRKMTELLPSPGFMRIHKSFIISVDKIESIGKNDVMIAGKDIPVGGLYKEQFQQYLAEWSVID